MPILSRQDPRNRSVAYPKATSQLSHAYPSFEMQFADLQNISVGQFVQRGLFSVTHSLLSRSVASVGQAGAKPQMGWVNTRSIVTTGAIMQYPQSRRDRAVVQLPRKAMCRNQLSTYVQLAIPIPHFASYPKPATIRLFNKLQKSLLDWGLSTSVGTEVSLVRLRGRKLEYFSAARTFTQHLKTFLLGVKEATGYSRWLPPTIAYNSLLFNADL